MPRRAFIRQAGWGAAALALPLPLQSFTMQTDKKNFDAIIIGGSYAGLAAGMALGRALKKVLIIDSGKPANAQTPHSHNFLTQDGNTPKGIASLGKQQVEKYADVSFFHGVALTGRKTVNGFEIATDTGAQFTSAQLIFATGIKDIMPDIAGFAACWGISAIHCPYCHGYEVRDTKTGILGNGEQAFEMARMIWNWTKDLTVFTNGKSTLDTAQAAKLSSHGIKIDERPIVALDHTYGYMDHLVFADGTHTPLKALYAPRPFVQHCDIPESLGCEITGEGYIKVDGFQETTVPGVYACGDNATRMRTVANAVSMGTTAGMSASKKLILERF